MNVRKLELRNGFLHLFLSFVFRFRPRAHASDAKHVVNAKHIRRMLLGFEIDSTVPKKGGRELQVDERGCEHDDSHTTLCPELRESGASLAVRSGSTQSWETRTSVRRVMYRPVMEEEEIIETTRVRLIALDRGGSSDVSQGQ